MEDLKVDDSLHPI